MSPFLSKRDLLIDAWWDVVAIKNAVLQSRTLYVLSLNVQEI